MQLIRENRPYEDYLQAKTPVNRDEARVSFVAEHLMGRVATRYENQDGISWQDPETILVQLTYEYVRDKIANATPESSTKLTWRASDVLNEHEGTCYAKANLVAALLRRNGIPTGFAYQYRRKTVDGPLVLHALNAVYLESLGGWLRLDTTFVPGSTAHSPLEIDPTEFANVDPDALVRPIRPELGEDNLPIIYAEPDRQLAGLFKKSSSLAELWAARPDRLDPQEHHHDNETLADDADDDHAHDACGHHDHHHHDHAHHQHDHAEQAHVDHAQSDQGQPEAVQSENPDDYLLDLLYGDPDDEEFCGGGAGGCAGCKGCH